MNSLQMQAIDRSTLSQCVALAVVIAAAPTRDYDSEWNTWGERWRTISITGLYQEAP